MNRLFLLLALWLTVAAGSWANPVDRQQALRTAQSFLSVRGKALNAPQGPALVRRAPSQAADQVAYYVFNAADNQGFVIVSGDDRTNAILGYTDCGAYDEAALPDNFKAWMQSYADQIAALGTATAASAPAKAAENRAAIAPLLSQKWNQGAPYNNLCPLYQGERCVTGCMAAAVAQIVGYHRWPQEATTSIPGYTTSQYGIRMPELPAVTFAWDKMQDTYGDADPDNAVATLMLYVGQMMQANYSPWASGAFMSYAQAGLVACFGYDPNMAYLTREEYGVSEWHDIIYGELAENRPVLYAGTANGAGHAFVCDGFDGQGFYHINWGWGGMCDGYFKLEVLNPGGSGIGGATNGGGYSSFQEALIGIQPPTGNPAKAPRMKCNGLKVTGNTISANFWNNSSGTHMYDMNFAIQNADGTLGDVLAGNMQSGSLASQYGLLDQSMTIKPGTLSAGTYKVVPVSRCTDDSNHPAEWQSGVVRGVYFEVNVVADGSVSIVKHPVQKVEATRFDVTGTLDAGEVQNVAITVNSLADDYVGELYLFASRKANMGSCVYHAGAAIEAGAGDVVPMLFTPDKAGKWNLWVATDEYGSNVIGHTTVSINGEVDETYYISVTEGHFNDTYPATFSVTVQNDSEVPYERWIGANIWIWGGSDWVYQGNPYAPYQEIPAGESRHFEIPLDNLQPDTYYFIYLLYNADKYTDQWTAFAADHYATQFQTTSAVTAIDGVTVKPVGEEIWHSLTGRKMQRPMGKGVYIRNGKKVIVK